MAITVAQANSHALAVLKLPSTAFSAETVRLANDVQSRISTFHFWHWLLTEAVNIVTSSGVQDYNLDTVDQNKVQEIADAAIASGGVIVNAILTRSTPVLPKTATQAQPYAVGLVSPTQLRFFPVPNAAFTLQWRYYAQPIVFTATSNNYQCPDTFHNVILAGNIWKLMQMLDDDRQQQQYEQFIAELSELRRSDLRTVGRRRL